MKDGDYTLHIKLSQQVMDSLAPNNLNLGVDAFLEELL